MGGWRRFGGILGIAVSALALAGAIAGTSRTTAQTEESPLTARGRFLFRVYCANCHGSGARGNGPSAELLKVAPADLTRLSERNDGVFPFETVYKIIDGRELVRGHGESQMPIWGLTFQELDRDVDQEDEVRGKILQLVHYLESIQSTPD